MTTIFNLKASQSALVSIIRTPCIPASTCKFELFEVTCSDRLMARNTIGYNVLFNAYFHGTLFLILISRGLNKYLFCYSSQETFVIKEHRLKKI